MRRTLGVAALLAVVSAACGGGISAPSSTLGGQTTTATSGTTTATSTTAAVGDGPVSTLTGVRSAVVRIEAQGSFIDPEQGAQFNVSGVGSGFIVDESGIAVTNNHVVTGAAFLQVYVDGEESPRNARVLGVSECSDLAVIDIDGDGYDYLEWRSDFAAGTDIYAAGFPLGTNEYTLLEGIVSKERAAGESNWASVEAVIEHSADTLPGNSGGPIVDADGRVIAVNYAGDGFGQSFAISGEVARPIIDQLTAERDVNSLGINGQAVVYDNGLSGVFVSSVETGSPAANARIRGGDLVIRLEGLVLGTDGTLADYCDILRSHSSADPLAVEVYRNDTGEFLEGTINGDPLETTAVLGAGGDEGSEPEGYQYVSVTDTSGFITVDVPSTWTATSLDYTDNSGTYIGPSLYVENADSSAGFVVTAAAIEALNDAFGVTTPAQALDSLSLSDPTNAYTGCSYEGREPYSDPLYTGRQDTWSCSTGVAFIRHVAAVPEDRIFIVWLELWASTADHLGALQQALDTFIVATG